MQIDILTLFPEMIDQVSGHSILGRAQKNGLISIRAVDIRAFTEDRHRKTDEAPFGGGEGMVMTVQPVSDALRAVDAGSKRIIYPSPKGRLLDQDLIEGLAAEQDLVFLCGHYEGIDQRILDYWKPEEVSIGDYILTGGELAALVMVDAVARLIPGVLGNEASAMSESVYSGLLESPQYTRPRMYENMSVPDVLLSGDHERIRLWRYRQSLLETREKRPDLWRTYLEKAGSLDLGKKEKEILAEISGVDAFRPDRRRRGKRKDARTEKE